MSSYNPELMQLAQWRLDQMLKMEKQAFMPAGADPSQGDPSQGGQPPMDPSMGGSAPPPMDPSMGGAPPMDPSMGGGAGPVPGGGGLTADSIAQIVTQTMQQQGAMGGGAGGGSGGGAGKTARPDINTVAMDIFQVKKLLQTLFTTMGIPIPDGILDGPNRDPRTGAPMAPGMPGSTSDPAMSPQPQPAAGGAAPGGQPEPSAGAQGSPGGIQPIQPMGGPAGGGDATKSSFDASLILGEPHFGGFDPRTINKAAALAAICRRIGAK